MAWYEYTILKRQYREIIADIQGWLARRRVRRDAAIKAVMREEIQKAEERIAKYIDRTIRLSEIAEERQNFRLTVIEKKLDIPTRANPLTGAPQHDPVSEQDKHLIEALLQPTPQVPLPGRGLPGAFCPKDRAQEKAQG